MKDFFVFAAGVVAMHLAASILPAAPAPAPATTQANDNGIDREIHHLQLVSDRIKKHPALSENSYVRLELSIARRFIDRVQHLDDKTRKQPADWTRVQMKQVGFVLAQTEKTIDQVEAGTLPPEGLGPVPVPTGGAVKIEDGVFVTSTKIPGEKEPRDRPYYFGGYGHFDQVVEDLPNFSQLATSLVQDGRNGPKQGLAKDYTLTPAGRAIKTMLSAAARGNVKVDILTSPHYFPDWATAAAPDMQNGTAFQNIDHPAARKVMESWLTQVGAQNKDEAALLSYCLSNEPVYSSSGRDAFSVKAWQAFLEKRHHSIAVLNDLYGTKFASFADVPASGWKDDTVEGKRWAYDWVCFNNEHFAKWHQWMGELLKGQDKRALTHAKIMAFFALDTDKAGWGIDPELFSHATDIAGCDAYAQMGAGVGPLDETTSNDYMYHWQVQELCYDLLHSFANQPVFNSENHPMPNATGAYEYPSRHTRAVYWQGGLHHQGATTTWVWDEAKDPALADSIYFRPANIWGQGRAMLDLNRLSAEVTAINRAKPTVAIVYSPTSIFWQPDYAKTVRNVYTALVFAGERVTFVSERQMAQGKITDARRIIFPHVTHFPEAAMRPVLELKASAKAASDRIVFVGRDCLAFDQYAHRRTTSQQDLVGDERSLFNQLPADNPVKLLDAKGERAWGIEFCAVPYENGCLIPLINHLKQPITVKLSMEGVAGEAVDLLSREMVSLDKIELKPMEPLLLRLDRK